MHCVWGAAGAHFARQRSERLLESRTAAPPTRNRQLGMSMERSLPKYQFCVMFSVEMTSAVLLGYTWRTQHTPSGPQPAFHAPYSKPRVRVLHAGHVCQLNNIRPAESVAGKRVLPFKQPPRSCN